MPKRWWWVLALVGLLTCGNAAAVAPLLISLAPALSADDDNTVLYKVVKNGEDQYGIWPADRENAVGWTDAGKTGTKAECLAWIREVWTDMRPESLRKAMEASGATSQPTAAPTSPPAAPAPDESTAAQAPAAEPAAAEEEEEESAEPEESAAPEESAPKDTAPSDEESFADDEAPADPEDAAEDATDATEEVGCVDEYGEPVEGPCE
jgi:MbtH protein